MKKQLLALALISSAFVSCTDDSYDLDNISNDYSIGLNEYLPIVSSQVNLKDILNEFKSEYISESGDGSLSFVFDTITHVELDPIKIVVNESSQAYSLDQNVTENDIDADGYIKSSGFQVDFPLKLDVSDENGEGRVDFIDIKSGVISFSVDGLNMSVSSPSITGVGSVTSNYVGEDRINIDLSDTRLDFTNDLNVTFTIKPTGKVKVEPGKTFSINMEETKITYNRIEGAFNSNEEQIQNTTFDVDLYDDNFYDYNLKVLNASLTVAATSNCGMPLACSIKNFEGRHKSKIEKNKKPYLVKFQENPFSDPSNSYDFNFEVTNKVSEYNFNKNFTDKVENNDDVKTDLAGLLNYMPDTISVTTGIRIAGDPNNDTRYYLEGDTWVDLAIGVSIPLAVGDSSYIIIKDTIDEIDIFDEVADYQDGNFKLDQAEIFIDFENSLPLEAKVSAQFCKADTAKNGDVTLTHLSKKLNQTVNVPSAEIVAGEVHASKTSTTKIKVSEDMVDDIKKINAVTFVYTIKVPENSVDGAYLKSNNGLSAKVYAHMKANISNSEK